MTTQTLTTTVTLPSGDEQEVKVTYTFTKGAPDTWDEPGWPDSVEIQSVVPDVPVDLHDALIEECFEDYAGYLADVEERRWEDRRDYERRF